MSITINADSSISQQVDNIVTRIVRDLAEEVQAGDIESTDDLDSATWSAVDNLQCVIYTYQAKLVATEADWNDFVDDFGAEGITPERLAFHHILSEVRGDDTYQELIEKLEHGEDD